MAPEVHYGNCNPFRDAGKCTCRMVNPLKPDVTPKLTPESAIRKLENAQSAIDGAIDAIRSGDWEDAQGFIDEADGLAGIWLWLDRKKSQGAK